MSSKISNYRIAQYWKTHKFKIVVLGSIVVLLGLAIYNYKHGHTGSYSLVYDYDPTVSIKVAAYAPRTSKGEIACREFLERVFLKPFPNVRPPFLKNSVTGQNLELDCCNLDLRLAVEYNGRQHYQYVPGMHKNHDAFRTQQYRDEMKARLCKENGFNLIIVPYTITVSNIDNYLAEKLQELGYKFD